MLQNIYEKGDCSPRICNDVLQVILETDKIKSSPQKIFAYCYLGLISYLNINQKYKQHDIQVYEIKRYLGYAEQNKKLDYIIKKNGVLNELGFIKDEPNPFKRNKRNRVKIPLILDEMRDCHTFNLSLFFKCLENSELGTMGFFIANYVKEFDNDYVYGVRGSVNYLSRVLNISKNTVTNYLNELSNNNLINSNKIRNHETLAEMSLYFRSKLIKWRNDSLDFYGNKCFVSGEKDNIVVHHLIPFNQIRDYVLNQLDLQDKPMDQFTSDELDLIEGKILDYHELSLGVPLNEKIHKQFHMQYGSNTTLENLLEFKYSYKI
jgi:hypothetical protein